MPRDVRGLDLSVFDLIVAIENSAADVVRELGVPESKLEVWPIRDPWGGDRAIFSARTRLNREDFGITWNQALEAGGLLVSKDIQIDINLETVLSAG